MKNLNSLLARLGALSLAAAMFFSAAQAATAGRKDPRATAVIEAIVQQSVAKSDAADAVRLSETDTVAYFSDKDVVIGSQAAKHHLCVYDYARVEGDVISGRIGRTKGDAGLKHLIGIANLDPRTQQFQVSFKDKKKTSHGAFVDLDFVTTVTSKNLGINDIGVATNRVTARGIYCHPQMTAAQIMGSPTANGNAGDNNFAAVQNMKSGGLSYSALVNGPTGLAAAGGSLKDLRLTPTVRVEAITSDVCFGFVPWNGAAYPVTNSSSTGFYDSKWTTSTKIPVWSTGVLAYQVKSDNICNVGVITSVVDSLQAADVFCLFTDDELATLLETLQDYFGSDTESLCKYLVANRHQLSRAFEALRD